MNDLHDQELDEQLRNALGTPPAADFDAWRSRHGDAVAYLNPVVSATIYRRRRMLVKIASLTVAATIFVVAGTWLFVPRESAFAQTLKTIDKAETIATTIIWYDRFHSEDGQRTWLKKAPRWERAYMAPSLFRDTKYDEDGNVVSIDIEDANSGKSLHLDMKKKVAAIKKERSGQFGPGDKLFAGIAKTLESKPVEYMGQRDISGVKVNVFRYRKEFLHDGMPPQHENWEIWLAAESKQLVGYCTSDGESYFDPATAPDRDNRPEPKFKFAEIAGVIHGDIVFDAKLDPKLFSLTPPDGFAVVEQPPRPTVSEADIIEWLRVTAGVNEGRFVETNRGLGHDRLVALADKPKADRSDAEKQYQELWLKHFSNGNRIPIMDFAEDSTEPKTFRYLGKGVKLGDADRIVCFYKLKGTNKYRAVYGDLTVKDVDPKDLPLPVDE